VTDLPVSRGDAGRTPSERTSPQGPARVLVASTEPLAGLIELALRHGPYEVALSTSIESAERALRESAPHLVIVDIDLSERRGLELLGRRDPQGSHRPIIAMTRRGDLKTKLEAFEHGADDFLTVPFSPEELVARVLAVMRRTYAEQVRFQPVIQVGDLQIDILAQRVRIGRSSLRLTAIELNILYLLASNPGRVMSRPAILDAVWGLDYLAESNVVDRHVRNLRVKLKEDWRRPRYIGTVSGRGYRFLVSSTT
jgi:DNA-binding response OmpR family regulator